jgi:hypothetical protein
MRRSQIFSGLLILALSACASTDHYRYLAEGSDGKVADPHSGEAFYPEPPKSPQGSVRLRSAGLVDLRPKGENERFPALHIRVTVKNSSADKTVWRFDGREQSALYPNHGQIGPLYVNSDTKGAPELEITSGQMRTEDLFFPLPDGVKSIKDVPEFDLNWILHTGDEVVHESTTFQRVEAEAPPPQAVYPYDYYNPWEPWGVGYGAGWYYYSSRPVWRPAIRVRH